MALLALKEMSKATSAFQKALELDPNCKVRLKENFSINDNKNMCLNLQEAIDGYRKCAIQLYSNPDEVRKRAMADPEIQKIMGDPAMRLILEQMQNDPKAVSE